MATFVLVHDAFGSPAELAPVIPLLEALDHRGIGFMGSAFMDGTDTSRWSGYL